MHFQSSLRACAWYGSVGLVHMPQNFGTASPHCDNGSLVVLCTGTGPLALVGIVHCCRVASDLCVLFRGNCVCRGFGCLYSPSGFWGRNIRAHSRQRGTCVVHMFGRRLPSLNAANCHIVLLPSGRRHRCRFGKPVCSFFLFSSPSVGRLPVCWMPHACLLLLFLQVNFLASLCRLSSILHVRGFPDMVLA